MLSFRPLISQWVKNDVFNNRMIVRMKVIMNAGVWETTWDPPHPGQQGRVLGHQPDASLSI